VEGKAWFALVFLLLVSCQKVVFDNGASFTVEIAKTQEEKTRGLMFRDFMPEDHGMLFVFDDFAPRSFWMKNTLIPLDIVFIDDNMAVVDVQTALPCKEDPCPTYRARAKYVLEINAGAAEKNNIRNGSVLSE